MDKKGCPVGKVNVYGRCLKKYPDSRRLFKRGEKVTRTYQYPDEKKRKYVGTIVKVGEDFIKVNWITVNGTLLNLPRDRKIGHHWDFATYGGIGYYTPIKHIKK